uniref:FERM domain-containing protein n=1 Tax=Phaeomonas parva TaxID=124430 RepID=A0A7S1U3J7_9STRA
MAGYDDGGMMQRLGNKVVVRVYMLDNSSKVLLADSQTTAEDICFAVAEKLDFEDVDDMAPLFALFDCLDGAVLTRHLVPEEPIEAAMKAWDDPERHQLVFMIKLYVDDLLHSNDEKIIYLQYVQAVYMVITGQYPCEVEECLALAALQLRHTFGIASQSPGFLGDRVCEFVPFSLVVFNGGGMGANLELWEEKMLAKANALNPAIDADQARLRYLERVEAWDCHGCTFFPANQAGMKDANGVRLPKKLVLGVCAEGVRLFSREAGVDLEQRRRALHKINITDMYKWGFVENEAFYVELGEGGKRVLFYTRKGQEIAALVEEYAMELLHNREVAEAGLAGAPVRLSNELEEYSEEEDTKETVKASSAGRSTPPKLCAVDVSDDEEEPPAEKAKKGAEVVDAMDGVGGGVLGAGAKPGSSRVDMNTMEEALSPVEHREHHAHGVSKPHNSITLQELREATQTEGAHPHEATSPNSDSSDETSMAADSALAALSEDKVDELLGGIVRLQALFRGTKLRSDWEREDAALCIQIYAREFLFKVNWATKLQASFRGYRVRRDLFSVAEDLMAMDDSAELAEEEEEDDDGSAEDEELEDDDEEEIEEDDDSEEVEVDKEGVEGGDDVDAQINAAAAADDDYKYNAKLWDNKSEPKASPNPSPNANAHAAAAAATAASKLEAPDEFSAYDDEDFDLGSEEPEEASYKPNGVGLGLGLGMDLKDGRASTPAQVAAKVEMEDDDDDEYGDSFEDDFED